MNRVKQELVFHFLKLNIAMSKHDQPFAPEGEVEKKEFVIVRSSEVAARRSEAAALRMEEAATRMEKAVKALEKANK